jgi:phenylalanyl-tRNA synthetase beta chain
MKISYDWLLDHININEPLDTISDLLTQSGLEVEGLEKFEKIKGGLQGIVIGEVLTCEKHPDADKLSVTTIDIGGEEPSPIVCGAPNIAKGQKVVVATVGAVLYPEGHDSFKIKKAKIRGVVSLGMVCAEDELGLGNSHDGIIVLDTDLPNGTPAAKYFELTEDYVIEIGLTPNRVDAASHRGTARDLKALLNRELRPLEEITFTKTADLPIEVKIENSEACPRYTGVTIANVKVAPSPQWLQDRLKAIGVSPMNNIVDATNYIMFDLGQPLHAFDYKVTGEKIIVKTLPEGTKFKTLDDVERTLDSKDLMICNETNPMCIGGVFGGIYSGVSESTTDIFLESAYFSADYVRATSLRHNLKTDAAFRFERGTDPNGCVEALNKAVKLILEIAGGNISSNLIDIYPNPVADFVVEVKFKNIDSLIGQEIPREKIKEILSNLDIKISSETQDGMTLAVAPYRVDVQREADVIEEILRIFGYNNIEVNDSISSSFLAPAIGQNEEITKTDIANVLAGFGFYEIMTNSLTKPSYTNNLDELNDEENVEMLNKLSEDLGIMRQTMLFTGLEVLAHNINRRQKNIKLYEFGKTYRSVETNYEETRHLSFYLTGNQKEESWDEKSSTASFHDLAKVVMNTLQKLNIPVESKKSTNSIYQSGLDLFSRKQQIGSIGIVSKKQLKKSGIKQEVVFADLLFDKLLEFQKNTLKYEEISRFPEVRRDLSLVIDKKVTFNEIKALTLKTERKLITSINVFDVYKGDNLGKGKKSYSVSYVLEDPNQTLKDKVIDKVMNKLINVYEKELNAIIRR